MPVKLIKPAQRMHNMRCPEKSWNLTNFTAITNARFENRFDYSETVLVGITKPITFGCPIHGLVTQEAKAHLTSKWGCPKCSSEQLKARGGAMRCHHSKQGMDDRIGEVVILYTSLQDVISKHGRTWGVLPKKATSKN